jgi:hypothetical protein
MPNVNVQFLGQTLIIPNAYYADNVSATLPANAGLTPPLIFIGNSYGLQPFVPTTFASGQDLLNALRGGPCSDFVQFLVNPSNSLNGASLITYLNCSENTQSHFTIFQEFYPSRPLINLTSANYGTPSNLLQITVQPPTSQFYFNGAAMNVTLYDGYSGQSAQGTQLGVPFAAAYTGTASGVTQITITAVASGLTFTLSSNNPGESFSVLLGPGGYTTIAQLVEFINGTGYWAAALASSTNGQLPANQLTTSTGITLFKPNPSTPTTYTWIAVPAYWNDTVYWVNNFASSLATATAVSGVSGFGLAYTSYSDAFFSGAQSIPPTTADYATALNIALTTPGWVTFCDSNSPAVIALGVANSVLSAEPGQNAWRRFVAGSSIGDSITATVSQATSMNAYEAVYCFPGVYRNDSISGVNTLFSGHHVAAAVAGMMAGNIVAQPLTNQALIGTGVEVSLSVSQINQLQTAGVLPISVPNATHVPTIVSDLTTWQVDNNPENVFTQQVACRFGLAYSLQQGLAPYVGSIASTFGLTMMKNAAISILNQLIYSPGNNGILASWDTKSLRLTYSGSNQTVNLSVNVVFVGQVRFILELVFVQPLALAA